VEELKRDNPGPLFDGSDPNLRRQVDLDDFELLDEDGHERKVYDLNGERVPRRSPVVTDRLRCVVSFVSVKTATVSTSHSM
jgi:hypothetical protein